MDNGYRTSPASPSWLRLVMPSIADAIFLAVLCTLVFTSLSLRLLGDAGIGWHIRTGQLIVATHQIPRLDPFSSSMAGKPWFAWEWLYDVVVGALDSAAGLNAVVWFNALILAVVFATTFQWLMKRNVNVAVAVPLVLLAISASMIHFLARPHLVSWLLTLAWFAILDTSERKAFCRGSGENHLLWILPVIIVIWVNLHGGFVVGFMLLAIYWLGACWTWSRTKPGRIEDDLIRLAAARHAWELFYVAVVCAAASLVNPYRWNLHHHVVAYLFNRFLMNHIQEFQSPDFHAWAQRCFLALILITVATLALRGPKLRASELLVILFSVYLGLYAARNIPLASVLLVMVVGPLVCPRPRSGLFGRIGLLQSSLGGHLWPAIAAIFTFAVALHGGRVPSAQLMNAHFDAQRMPVGAVDYIQQHGLPGPVLSTDFWGGYLVYRLHPQQQVVLDDRHDLYGEAFFKSYLKMFRGEEHWQEFLRQNPAGCLLFPKNAAITNLLLAGADWKMVYEDDVAAIFVKVQAP